MILQIGAFFSTLVSGVARGVTQIAQAAAPGLLGIGQQFLQRELNRKLGTQQRRQVQARAVEVLNTPGISVARLGGTTQPVGGRVQRATFQPAATTPAQSAIGNIPLLPVRSTPPLGFKIPFGFGFPQPSNFPVQGAAMANEPLALPGPTTGARGEPRFARDQFGKTIMFVPSPRPGEGFITVLQARQLGLSPTRPFWRFNRIEGQFEKIKPRRLNPFNFRAAARAGRRIDRTLEAVKSVVVIHKRKTKGIAAAGQVVKFKTKKKK